MGAEVALITVDSNKIGVMSCNPAIGGIGKGHIVKEIDAMGGVMAQAADKASIQYKVLNSSKGPAVRGPRCQADRALYQKAIKQNLEAYSNIDIFSKMVSSLIIKKKKVEGVVLEKKQKIFAGAVVLTTGTFLNGIIHMGNEKTSAGRVNEKASKELGDFLLSLSLPMARLKTGTPPRILKSTIDYKVLEEDLGDVSPKYFFSGLESFGGLGISSNINLLENFQFIPEINTSLKNNIHENSLTKTMIKKIQITLLVEVDTENTELCPNGDPLLENCVINTIEDDFFLEPVEILEVKEYQK